MSEVGAGTTGQGAPLARGDDLRGGRHTWVATIPRRLAAVALPLACILLVAPSAASAKGTLDQQQTNLTLAYFDEGISFAQTFTAGLSGELNEVELYLSNRTLTSSLTIQIRNVEASGAPGATVLASETVPASSVPEEPGGFVPVTFVTPTNVSAGSRYAIVVYETTPAGGEFLVWGAEENPYPSGAAWVSFSAPPTTWREEVEVDLAFKTYVTVPPKPTTLTTSLSGEGKSGESITVKEHEEVSDQASLSGENAAKAEGRITYVLYSSSGCPPDSRVAEASEPFSNGSVPYSGYFSEGPGIYYWTAEYSGDANNEKSESKCGAEVETVQAQSSITTYLTQNGNNTNHGEKITVQEGSEVFDTALIKGHTDSSEGAASFKVYSDAKCEHLVTAAGSHSEPVPSDPTSNSENLPAGTYYWQAEYAGDKTNTASKSECGAEVETVQAQSSITTYLTQTGNSANHGPKITIEEGTGAYDTAEIKGHTDESEGKVVFNVYSDKQCSKLVTEAGHTSAGVPSQPNSASENLPAGTYYWQAEYAGDQTNTASKSECGAEVETVTAKPKPATCGTTTVGRIADSLSANLKRVNRCVLPTNAKVLELTEYLSPTSTRGQQLIKGIVYANSKGNPGALVGVTEQLTFKSSNAAGWYHMAFKAPLKLSAGTYWFGTITGYSAGVAAEHYTSVTNVEDYNYNTYTSGPSSFFGYFSHTNEQVSLYATYLPEAG